MTDERKLEIMNNILIAYRECLFSEEDNLTVMNKPEFQAGYYLQKWYSNETFEDIIAKDKEIFKKAVEKQKEKIKQRKRTIFKTKEEMFQFLDECFGFLYDDTVAYDLRVKDLYARAYSGGVIYGVARSSGFDLDEVEHRYKFGTWVYR
ncbi:hypothetical protein [Mammaliicoccus sciuri]|uniref:hypothetical protein n=1 Tax=Mammaliicoccus sciuri TaxID=1296 RepID=UPI0021D1CB2A|nr:hypothetical protein [Mammaliicoccus sciuri]UXU70241.1 hypothetical protein MUA36_06030 [Mammaliicoccus sciuri]